MLSIQLRRQGRQQRPKQGRRLKSRGLWKKKTKESD